MTDTLGQFHRGKDENPRMSERAWMRLCGPQLRTDKNLFQKRSAVVASAVTVDHGLVSSTL